MGKDIIARGIAAEALKQAGAGGGGGGTVSVEVTRTITGNPGTEASVINEGTDTEVRLVFTVPQGAAGPKGDMGKTPQKGTDYWTALDKQELVNDVLKALPKYEGGEF